MKSVCSTFLLFGALCGVICGCDLSSTRTPGATEVDLAKPSDQILRRGKTNDVKIAIQRRDNNAPVQIEFEQLPKGVHVTEEVTEIAGDEASASFTLHADPEAELVTNHTAVVTAKAPGVDDSESFRITVEQ